MGEPAEPPKDEAPKEESPAEVSDAALVALANRWPFGPAFFLSQLSAFVRGTCADPGEGLSVVEVHLADGDVLDLCHVVGIAPSWAALAVNNVDAPEDEPRMRTELVPYAQIARITVRAARTDAPHIGFVHDHTPDVLANGGAVPATPEAALRAAAGNPPG